MIWADVIVALILFFSLVGGFTSGVVKSFFSLLIAIIAIPLTGVFYHILTNVFSFLPGENWDGFVGFFVMLIIISIILYIIFLLPRKIIEKVWQGGCIFRLVGGVLGILNSAIGLTLFGLVVLTYPVFGWLERAVSQSVILPWLVTHFTFVAAMLPELFRAPVSQIVSIKTLKI